MPALAASKVKGQRSNAPYKSACSDTNNYYQAFISPIKPQYSILIPAFVVNTLFLCYESVVSTFMNEGTTHLYRTSIALASHAYKRMQY